MRDLGITQHFGGSNPLELGRQTVEFVNFFFRDPRKALQSLSNDYVDSGAFRVDMADMTFLRQERLRKELASFLERFGFAEDEVALCHKLPPVNRTIGGAADRQSLWTKEALATVATRERFLFRMLAHLGIDCQEPQQLSGGAAAAA
jgi:hypothetical protein